MTSKAYLTDIQKKIRQYRIESSITQKELASITGLSLRSIQRFEGGGDISLENFLKILIALNLDEQVTGSIPDTDNRPSVYLERIKGKTKHRVRKMDKPANAEFKWGDEA